MPSPSSSPSTRLAVVAALFLVALVVAPAPGEAAVVDKDVPFALDTWFDVSSSDGPLTIHRVRVSLERGNVKSMLTRPGNAEYLETVQVQVEYTNDATRDYDAKLDIHWLDSSGKVIDGYTDEENMDEESRHDEMTATFSTLKYGLERAKTLHIGIRY